jgi:LppP/LprE lipoprotein
MGLAGLLLAVLVAAQAPGPGAWLETSPPANWNVPGAALPLAPPPRLETDPRCTAQERPAESPEEDKVVAAGWRLFNGALVGWGVRVVYGLVNHDGMCRPLEFHGFVFADGQFAGTISPTSLDSRTDGVGRVLDLNAPGRLTAQFVRYKETDPLCCPSSTFFVDYQVDRTGEAPVLVPRSSTRTGSP